MIKKILLLTVSFYQMYVSALLKNILGVNKMCRLSPTCSEYTKQMVKQRGVFGIILGVKRIGGCR